MEAKLTDLELYGEGDYATMYYSPILNMYVYVDKETNVVLSALSEEKDDE